MDKTNIIIKKSHDLVNARYNLNIWETRVFTKMLSMIHTKDKGFKVYKFPVSEFIKDFNIRHKDVYGEIRKVTDTLLKRVVEIPIVEDNKHKVFKTTLVSSFKYNVDEK